MKSLGDYIIVNYHYVHDPRTNSSVGGVFPCEPQEFERQIDFLSREYKVVSVPEVFEAAKTSKNGKFCGLTFDDGLKDHFTVVLPVLQRYGLTGTFFIIAGALDGRMSLAHKVHAARSRFSVPALTDEFRNFMAGEYPALAQDYSIPTDYFLDKKERYDDILTSNFKTTIARLPRETAYQFLASVFQRLGWEESAKTKELFMTEDEIIALAEAGMTIGSHGLSHDSFLVLDDETINEEVGRSRRTLEALIGRAVTVFSYPHGHFKEHHPTLLVKVGFKYAVTTGASRGLTSSDHQFRLPRYDTTDLKKALAAK